MSYFGDFRKVNPYLDQKPNLGPFPANQLIPWMIILGISYYVFKIFLGLSWLWTGLLAAWWMTTWWMLTGSKAWRFLAKFVGKPYWVRGYGRYQRFLDAQNRFPRP